MGRVSKSITIPGTILAGISLVLLFLLTIHPVEPVEASQVENALVRTNVTGRLFLPVIARSKACILSGRTTPIGSPTSVVLGLSQLITVNKTLLYTATSDLSGSFCFSDVPVLSACDKVHGYSVYFGYNLPTPVPQYAANWGTPLLTRCAARCTIIFKPS